MVTRGGCFVLPGAHLPSKSASSPPCPTPSSHSPFHVHFGRGRGALWGRQRPLWLSSQHRSSPRAGALSALSPSREPLTCHSAFKRRLSLLFFARRLIFIFYYRNFQESIKVHNNIMEPLVTTSKTTSILPVFTYQSSPLFFTRVFKSKSKSSEISLLHLTANAL